MKKLLMLKGLPASGKSTYARELVAKGWKRVNKDDLRAMIDDSKWTRKNEKEIIRARNILVGFWLESENNVVVDDTGFAPKHEEALREIAEQCGAEFEVKFFEISLAESLERDSKRGDKSVGAEVICQMYDQFIRKEIPYDPELPNCYIVDIDGTLANKGDRSPYDFSLVHLDTPNQSMVIVYNLLSQARVENVDMIILSGREDSCKEATDKWLEENGVFYDKIFMRKTGDSRKDSIIKKEIYEQNIKGQYNVIGVFDDRLQVCRMWYELGLPLFRVGNPDSAF